ncbi:hypothetical protein NFI96_021066, partial [Prochilodus magdalenae]
AHAHSPSSPPVLVWCPVTACVKATWKHLHTNRHTTEDAGEDHRMGLRDLRGWIPTQSGSEGLPHGLKEGSGHNNGLRMMSKPPPGSLQYIIIASVLLACLIITFYVSYEPISNAILPKQDVCPEGRLQTQIPEDPASTNGSEIVVLVWTWPFGEQFDLNSCESHYGIRGCHLTLDRSQFDKAHSVMFHLRDIGGDLPYLLSVSRPPRQKWVWMNMESPAHSPQLAGADDLFNLTSNYRRDSDVWVPYGRLVEVSEKDKAFTLPKKDKLVCWIVSNWNNNYRRVGYFNEFSQHIKIEAYGRHFGRYINHEDYTKVVSSCKFYLAFENSVFRDYITEKLYKPMSLGTVPVVLGPPRENYEEYIPKDSFIHVDDFKTPQELAEHLKLLDQNQEMYERYFTWRKEYAVRQSVFGQEHACRICDHMRKFKTFRVFKNVNKWYWS